MDGYIDWNVIGGYGLKPHTPGQYQPTVPSTPIHTDDVISFEVSFDGHLVIKPVKVNNDSAGRIDQSRNSGGTLNVALNVSAGGNISVKPSQKSINNTKETKKAHHVSTEKKQKKGNSFFAALLALFSAFCVSIGFK